MATDILSDFNERVPPVLFRGDQAQRRCKTTGQDLCVSRYKSCGLYTNLICGGCSDYVDRTGIRASVAEHIQGWATSHYLSFTESETIAEFFAKAGMEEKQLVPHSEEDFDAVIFEFRKADWNWKVHSVGIYLGSGRMVIRNNPREKTANHQIALIDNVTVLKRSIDEKEAPYHKELELAQRYQEWLIIPLDPVDLGPVGGTGKTAQLLPGAVRGREYLLED